ncbi:EAL domain-containing protein [Ruminococcus sp.]|mgnify:CR=1 FL=1|uniref:EAL domain-containing protein n=1 Tax=Ruminococcus sp. TaxID=41978 RepID=UPI0025E4FC27|nr:EAL domain-containing protein [Ruminococcus sp.]
MDYITHYDICSLVLYFITGVIFYMTKRIPCVRNKVFGMLLGVAAGSAVFDLLTVYSNASWGIGLKLFFHVAYYVTHTLIPFVFVMYILYLTDKIKSMSKGFRAVLFIPETVNLLLIITSPLTKFIVNVTSDGVYERGILQPVCYVIAIYYLVFGILFALSNRNMISKQVVTAIIAFCSMTTLAVCIQIINRSLLIECFSASVCIMLIMFTLQNQDDMIDSGTKMLNRSTFMNNCAVNSASGMVYSILLIRIPDFRMLMKTFGGRYTNSLLRSFSDYLYTFVNLGDGYYLEDECFALVFRKDSESVGRVYREIREKLQSNWQIGTVDTFITASFMRIDCPGDADNAEIIMDYVEQFKHIKQPSEKLLHTTNINFYDQKRRSEVELAIDNALENRGFAVFYQPIYSGEKGRIVSCEALVRLFDDKLGCISPDEFIPIAEENGKILRIGKFVFEEACRFIKKGEATKLGIEYVQVNLSVVQCMQSDLVEQLLGIMDRYKVDPSKICLEVTETAAVYTPHIMEKNIRTLSDCGVRFALDDYGSGYSNMTYLLNLPFRFIKLEKEIVWAGFKSEKAQIAIESTVAMIKKLNMQIVAEGVEEKHQLERLLAMGCDFIQGYYYSKPVPESEFMQVLEKYNAKVLETVGV